MTTNKVKVTGSSDAGEIPVRRRNPQGSEIEQVSASIPKKLAQKINNIKVETEASRSKVISDLIADGFKYRGESHE